MKGKIKTTLLITVLLISTLAAAIPIASAQSIGISYIYKTGTNTETYAGYVEDKVTVIITDNTMGGLVKVYWDSVKAWDGTAGLIAEDYAVGSGAEIDIVIPETVNGEHYVIVKDIEASLLDSHVFEIVPEIDLAQTSGIAGDTITITGTGFPGSETLDIFFGNAADTTAAKPHILHGGEDGTAEWTEDPAMSGTYGDVMSVTMTGSDVCASIYVENGPTWDAVFGAIGTSDLVTYQYYTLDGTLHPNLELRFEAPNCIDADDDESDRRGHVDVTVNGQTGVATGTWAPATAMTGGDSVWAFGNDDLDGDDDWSNFEDLTAVDALIDGDPEKGHDWILTRVSVQAPDSKIYYVDKIAVYDTVATAMVTYDLEQPVKTTTSGSLGSFTTTYKTSVDEPSAAKTLSVMGDVDNSVAFAAFDMGVCITLTPSTGIPSTEITVLGRGFTGEETIDIRWYYSTGEYDPEDVYLTVVDNYPIDSVGVFTTTFNVPLVETVTYYVVAIDSSEDEVTSPEVAFAVTGVTSITVTDSTGLVGDTFDVDGVWFTPDSTAEISFGEIVLATDVDINAEGELDTTNVEVPDVALGSHTVTVTDEEDIYATAIFTVIEEVITIETNSESYDPGDTLSFTIESTVAFKPYTPSVPGTIVIKIDDPDGYTFWEVTWEIAGTPEDGFYVPYSKQTDAADQHLTLPSDAEQGTWDWTATYTLLETTVETEVTGTFTVGEPVGPQPDLPAETTEEETLDSTGAPKDSFVMGDSVLASAKVTNAGTETQKMLIVYQLIDPAYHAVPPSYAEIELPTGLYLAPKLPFTLELGKGYTAGTWTLKIMVVDDWPAQGGVMIGEPVTITFTVS